MNRRPGAALALFAFLPGVVSAQARVHGTVRDSTQGTPLPLVEVVVPGMNLSTLTDADGRYTLSIPLGFHTLMYRRVGYHPATRQLRLSADDSVRVDIAMLSQAHRLDSVVVDAPAPPPIWPPGIGERIKEGYGTFINDSTLRRFDHSSFTNLLQSRAKAVRIMRVEGRPMAIARRGDPLGEDCFMAVWLDGVQLFQGGRVEFDRSRRMTALNSYYPPDLDRVVAIRGLTAVEVYTGANVPSQFRGGFASCGTIVIWTRQGLNAEPVR